MGDDLGAALLVHLVKLVSEVCSGDSISLEGHSADVGVAGNVCLHGLGKLRCHDGGSL